MSEIVQPEGEAYVNKLKRLGRSDLAVDVGMLGNRKVQMASIEALVIRADGTREELGIVSYYNRNPFKQAAFNVKKRFKKIERG